MHPNVDRLKNNLKDRERNKVIKEVLELIDERIEISKKGMELMKNTYGENSHGFGEEHGCYSELLFLKHEIQELAE